MFLKPLIPIMLSTTSLIQSVDVTAYKDKSESSFEGLSRIVDKSSSVPENRYEVTPSTTNLLMSQSTIDNNQLLPKNDSDHQSILVRAQDTDGKYIDGNSASDNITLLVRGGPIFLNDYAQTKYDFLLDPFTMFEGNNQTKANYQSLFDKNMQDKFKSTSDIYMLNEDNFYIDPIIHANELNNMSSSQKLSEFFRINYSNAFRLKKAVDDIKKLKPNAKINVISWSYGSEISNMTLGLFPNVIENVSKWVTAGTGFDQETHLYFNHLDDLAVYINKLSNYINFDKFEPSYYNRGTILTHMVGTSCYNFIKYLKSISSTDSFDYISYLKSSNKLSFFQNAYDTSIGALSNDEINQLKEIGNVSIDSTDWEKISSNNINHYSFRRSEQQGNLLLEEIYGQAN